MRRPGPSASVSFSQRTSVWLPFSCAITYGKCRSATLRAVQRRTARPSLRSAVALVRPAAVPLRRVVRARQLQLEADARQGRQLAVCVEGGRRRRSCRRRHLVDRLSGRARCRVPASAALDRHRAAGSRYAARRAAPGRPASARSRPACAPALGEARARRRPRRCRSGTRQRCGTSGPASCSSPFHGRTTRLPFSKAAVELRAGEDDARRVARAPPRGPADRPQAGARRRPVAGRRAAPTPPRVPSAPTAAPRAGRSAAPGTPVAARAESSRRVVTAAVSSRLSPAPSGRAARPACPTARRRRPPAAASRATGARGR